MEDIQKKAKFRRELRGVTIQTRWKETVTNNVLNNSSESNQFTQKKDIFYSVKGKGKGIWGLKNTKDSTPKSVDIEPPPTPNRTSVTIYRILRDTALARRLKKLHKNQCQICGGSIQLRNGETYSEAHHIQPLGEPHRGPDIEENIIVLCPNHHAYCDYRSILLDVNKLRMATGHSIGIKFVQYHNNNILPSFN